MSKYKIYHNPKCSKSRKTLEILNENGIKPTIIEYKESGLTELQVNEILNKLDTNSSLLIRNKDQDFLNNPFELDSIEEIVKGLLKLPQVLQRPIVLKGDKAIICRPPEKVLELI